MSKHPLLLTIANPCDQSWDEMQPFGMGRDCAHCQKTVIDFTHWSDAALYEFFANNNTKVCGRFLKTQVGRPIAIPYQPHSKLYRLTIALGLTLIFAQIPEAMAQNRPPKAKHPMVELRQIKKKTVSKKEHYLKPHVVSAYRKPIEDIPESRTVITGEVVDPWEVRNPDTMRVVPEPPMPERKKQLPSGGIEMDINNPTKKVFKRE